MNTHLARVESLSRAYRKKTKIQGVCQPHWKRYRNLAGEMRAAVRREYEIAGVPVPRQYR